MSQSKHTIKIVTKGAQKGAAGIKKLGSSLTSLAKVGMVGATGGAIALGLALKKATADAGVQERAEMKLATALGHTNQKLLDQASALQQQSKFGDEVILETMALGSNMGIAENQLANTTQMAIGLAEAYNLDLKMAMKMASAAVQGDTMMLNRYIPTLKGVKDQTEAMAIVQKGAAAGFEQSKANVDTMNGSLSQMKMALGDTSEELGFIIAPLVKAGAVATTKFANKLGEAFKSMQDIDFGKTFDNMVTNMGALQTLVVDSFKLSFSVIPDIFRFYVDKMWPLAKKALGVLWEGTKSLAKFIWEPIGIGIRIVLSKVQNFFIGTLNFLKEQFNTLAGFANKLGADIQPLEMSQLIDTEGLSMANTEMVELLRSGSEDNLNTFGDFQAAQLELYANYANSVVARNEEIEKSTNKTSKTVVKGQAAQGDATKATTKITKKSAIQQGMSASSAIGAVRNVIKAKLGEMLAGLLAKEITSKGFIGVLTGAAMAGAANALFESVVPKFATGGDFITSGPQMIMVGDNPGGQERVQISPLSSPNIDGPQGSVNISFTGNVMSKDFIEDEAIPQIKEAIRRGADLGIA